MSYRFTEREITKIMDALIGATTAVGDSHEDEIIEKNLKTLIDVINWCMDGLADSARTRHNYQGSMRDVGERAFSAMCEYRDWLNEQIEVTP